MSLRILCFCCFLVLGLASACSSPQSRTESDEALKTPPKVDEPQCFQGCRLNSSNECTTEGNVMYWSSSSTETIDCDPRCCQKGATTMGGGTDSDGDGIYDDADQCPDQPEDHDGFQDADGCPDPDNDGDQIPDDVDLCPLDAEDFDGFQDSDGCPDV